MSNMTRVTHLYFLQDFEILRCGEYLFFPQQHGNDNGKKGKRAGGELKGRFLSWWNSATNCNYYHCWVPSFRPSVLPSLQETRKEFRWPHKEPMIHISSPKHEGSRPRDTELTCKRKPSPELMEHKTRKTHLPGMWKKLPSTFKTGLLQIIWMASTVRNSPKTLSLSLLYKTSTLPPTKNCYFCFPIDDGTWMVHLVSLSLHCPCSCCNDKTLCVIN